MFKKLLLLTVIGLLAVVMLPKLSLLSESFNVSAAPNRPRPTQKPKPTPTQRPTPTPVPTPVPTATPSPTPTPTPTPTPSPTPMPSPTTSPSPSPVGPIITSIITSKCTGGSSCAYYLTTVTVQGSGFSSNSRVSLKASYYSGSYIYGYYVGGNGSSNIITDFYNLPLCTTYDVTVTGSTGTTTSTRAITSPCQ